MAVLACKLIREHSIELRMPEPEAETAPPLVLTSPVVDEADLFSNGHAARAAQAAAAQTQKAATPPPASRAPPPWQNYETSSAPPFTFKKPRKGGPRSKVTKSSSNGGGHDRTGPMLRATALVNKFQAWCFACGVSMDPGETVFWRKGVGTTCQSCGVEALNKVEVKT